MLLDIVLNSKWQQQKSLN